MSYNSKVRKEQNPDVLTVALGGEIKIATGGKITANGTQPATIADITTSASGTQISVAVNAIIAALKGAGIIASS